MQTSSDRQTDLHPNNWTDQQTENARHPGRLAERKTDRDNERQSDSQGDRQTDLPNSKQVGSLFLILNILILNTETRFKLFQTPPPKQRQTDRHCLSLSTICQTGHPASGPSCRAHLWVQQPTIQSSVLRGGSKDHQGSQPRTPATKLLPHDHPAGRSRTSRSEAVLKQSGYQSQIGH